MDKRDLRYEQYIQDRIALREANEKIEKVQAKMYEVIDAYHKMLDLAGELARRVKEYENNFLK